MKALFLAALFCCCHLLVHVCVARGFLSADVSPSWKSAVSFAPRTTGHDSLLQLSKAASTASSSSRPAKPKQRRRSWDESFRLLLEFKDENGHCNVPFRCKQDLHLGDWVHRQRKANIEGKLKEETQAKLENIGFSWHPLQDSWNESYQKLMEHRDNHGDCNVPMNWDNDTALALWVKRQRMRRDCLSNDRRSKLDKIGFSWHLVRPWDELCEEIAHHRDEHGDCNVPMKHAPNPSLPNCVKRQRMRGDCLSHDRRSKLDKIGFSWHLVRPWDELHEELVHCRDEHGDCNVPMKCAPNPSLPNWVREQRRQRAALSMEQQAKLDAINFAWENSKEERSNKQWHAMLEKLEKYRQRHGDCLVPQRWSKDPSLGNWVLRQRQECRMGLLDQDRERELNNLEFSWRVRPANDGCNELHEELWLDNYEALEDFKEKHGHVNVPKRNNGTLGTWVHKQRALYRQECLREDRKNLLEEVGFDWAVQGKQRDHQWHQKHSIHRALVDSGENPSPVPASLGIWTNRQRVRHANGRLPKERKALLDDIGFACGTGDPWIPRSKPQASVVCRRGWSVAVCTDDQMPTSKLKIEAASTSLDLVFWKNSRFEAKTRHVLWRRSQSSMCLSTAERHGITKMATVFI